MSVGFTDEEKDAMLSKGYAADVSELGNVFYPKEGIIIRDKISVNYVEYPWLTRFEVDGIEFEKKDRDK